MKRVLLGVIGVVTLRAMSACVSPAARQPEGDVGSLSGMKSLREYRDWRLISVGHEEGHLDDLRAILGNDMAIDASRQGRPSFPDGAIIVRLAWGYAPLEESAEAFGSPQSHVAGRPKNGVQFMVKDSRKYAATGGWGFAQFDDGKPAGESVLATCFPCHAIVSSRDFVFNRYAP
jgi:hypothetical protein